jgi:hypothetical protein
MRFKAPPAPPVIALPTGICASVRPRIEWRGEPHDGFEVRVTDGVSACGGVVRRSGTVHGQADAWTPLADLPVERTLHCHVRLHNRHGWGGWNQLAALFRIEPLPQAGGTLAVYDLSYTRSLPPARAFEHAHLVSALQGIVNRGGPRLFVRFVEGIGNPSDVDGWWLRTLRGRARWLEHAVIEEVPDIGALVQRFRDAVQGVVVWDPGVVATSNVASTIAGAEDLLPLPLDSAPDSLHSRLVANGPRLPVVRNLAGLFSGTGIIPGTGLPSTGSRKCDAYLWAREHYLDTGICDPAHMGYYMDAFWIRNPNPGGNWQNHTLTNHDYFIARRGFFWDLNVWGDESPVDDPAQRPGEDLRTLKAILGAAARRLGGTRLIHVGGFTPWAFKYTDFPGAGGTRGGVQTEWETVRILSQFNAYIDADALRLSAMANASVHMHHPLPRRQSQPGPVTPDELRARGLLAPDGSVAPRAFVLHYVGDYDSAAWVTQHLFATWEAGNRGSVNMAWAVNPNLCERAAQFFAHAHLTRTARDHFMAGDSGAGYVNPTELLAPRAESGLPPVEDAWAAQCARYYRRFGMSFTGFLINGRAGVITPAAERMYEPFSPDGIANQYGCFHEPLHLEGNMPAFVLECDLSDDVEADAGTIHEAMDRTPPDRRFLVFRSVLRDVAYYAALNARLTETRPDLGYEFCLPAEFARLARAALGGSNEGFAAYLWDTIPPQMARGETRRVDFAVRNDGWDTWQAEGPGAVSLHAECDGEALAQIALARPVPPGDAVLIEGVLAAPSRTGTARVRYGLVRGDGTGFSRGGTADSECEITVV